MPQRKLMTKKLKGKLPGFGTQDEVADPIVHARFFNPLGPGEWLVTEAYRMDEEGQTQPIDSETPDEEIYLFGLGHIQVAELGTTMLRQLKELSPRIPIERETHFQPKPLSEAIKESHVIREDYGGKIVLSIIEDRKKEAEAQAREEEGGPLEGEAAAEGQPVA